MRVLLVEDHDDTRRVLTRLLRHWGFDVVPVENLSNGLGLLEHETFEAVVSDIALPDGTGYALIKEAKRRSAGILGVALSAYGSELDIHLGREAGFDRHLTKPFDGHELRSLLEERSAQTAQKADSSKSTRPL